MRAIVAVPSIEDFYFTRHRFSSLGAKHVSLILSRLGIETDFIDFPLSGAGGRSIDTPAALSHLAPYLLPDETGGVSFFTRYRRFGPGDRESAERICAFHPDIVFLSCFAFCYLDQAAALIRAIKQRDPRLPVMAGGPGVKVHPHYLFEKSGIDFVFTGDAVRDIPVFIDAYKQNDNRRYASVPGLYYRENGTIVTCQAKPQHPKSDLEFVYHITRETGKKVFISTRLTQGCTKKCRFCTHWSSDDMAFVHPEKIEAGIEDIAVCIGEPGREVVINFEDDNLLVDAGYFCRVLELFRQRLPGISFFAEPGLDYTLCPLPLADQLVRLGVKRFNFSLGSANPHIAGKEQRQLVPDKYESLVSFLAEKSVPSTTYFICGFSGDTKKSTAENLLYIAGKPTTCGISLFYPVPGLPGFSDLDRFLETPTMLSAGSSAYPWNNSLSTQTLVTAFRLSRYINFSKSVPGSAFEAQLCEKIRSEKKLYTIIKEKKAAKIVRVPHPDEELEQLFFG